MECFLMNIDFLCTSISCYAQERQDGKNVIFKIIDLPEMKKSLKHFNEPPSADILNNLE